jgi:hypothetical protein
MIAITTNSSMSVNARFRFIALLPISPSDFDCPIV